tara:strand:- start:64 stop:264 length:201 start_codon:yes stop_codon:yes gene_type:complete
VEASVFWRHARYPRDTGYREHGYNLTYPHITCNQRGSRLLLAPSQAASCKLVVPAEKAEGGFRRPI